MGHGTLALRRPRQRPRRSKQAMIKSYKPRSVPTPTVPITGRVHFCEPSLDDSRFESLLLELHAAIDVPGFWRTIQSILDQVVPNDAFVVYLNFIDFSQTWSASKILATRNAEKPAEWLQGRREVDVMPAFILSHPGTKLYQLSDVVPDSRKLHRSEFFRRYMAPEGWHYTACSLFWEESRLASEIAIRRTAEQGNFTSREMGLLNRLHPHIETALRRLAAIERRAVTASMSETTHQAASSAPVHPLCGRLTPAERELVLLVREGWSNKEIAAQLEKSVRTVKTQFTSVYKKCGVRSRTRLLAMMR